MSLKKPKVSVWGRSLNTLAESETGNFQKNVGKKVAIIYGQGSELGRNNEGKAKRKMISQKLSPGLAEIADRNDNTIMKKSFWNTYYCQNELTTVDGRHYGNYCKNRYCTLCGSNRKASIIKSYLPVLKEWHEPYFVTLTVPAC